MKICPRCKIGLSEGLRYSDPTKIIIWEGEKAEVCEKCAEDIRKENIKSYKLEETPDDKNKTDNL